MTIKTDWKDGDNFDIIEDFNRVNSNLNQVCDIAESLYSIEKVIIPEYDYTRIYSSNDLDGIETNIQTLIDAIGIENLFEPTRKIWDGIGDPTQVIPWTPEDINRVERTIYLLYRLILGQKNGLRRLSFRLKGGRL